MEGSTAREEEVRLIATGDPGALRGLYDATSAQAYGLALRIASDSSGAERACEGAYHRAAELASAATSLMDLEARLLSLVRELALRERPAQPAMSSLPPDVSYSDVKAIREGVEELDPLARKVLDLTYFGGLSIQEASGILDQPASELRSLLRTSLLHLGRAVGAER
jgi:RNA polymerase sigma-70 factor (ECF subfamily)